MPRALLFAVALSGAAPLAAQEWGPWQVIGPFPHAKGSANIDDPTAVEEDLPRFVLDGPGPDPSARYRGKEDLRLSWAALADPALESLDADGTPIHFARVLPAPPATPRWANLAVAYLHRTVRVESDQEIRILVGSDDGLRLWLNGELLIDRAVPRPLRVADHELVLSLRAGTNHLLAKVANGNGGWSFQMRRWREPDPAAVAEALEAGIAYLLGEQLVDGSWGHHEEYGAGHTAFVAYSLLKAGVDADHPALQRAFAFVFARPADHTYSLSSAILAVATRNAPADRDWLEDAVERLLSWQESTGLYAYPAHPAHGGALPDVSNTAFAALAFRAASQAGVAIPRQAWEDLAKGTLRCQEPITGKGKAPRPAGFCYRQGTAITGSMTTSAVAVLAMAREALAHGKSNRFLRDLEQSIASGVAWMEEHILEGGNPGHPQNAYGSFHLYGIERVCGILDLDSLGGVDWYRENAGRLVSARGARDAWGMGDGGTATPIALLFLNRATRRAVTGKEIGPRQLSALESARDSDVRLHAEPGPPLTLWIAGFSAEAMEEWSWTEPGAEGLRVQQVVYEARRVGSGAAFELLATVARDPNAAEGSGRFPAQVALPSAEEWEVRAAVTLWGPPLNPGESHEEVILHSSPLPVPVRGGVAVEARVLDYPNDRTANLLLRDRRPQIEASSTLDATRGGGKAFDGSHATDWLCGVADERPSIRIRLARSTRANTVLLSHARARLSAVGAARAARVELRVNGDRIADLVLDPAAGRKTEYSLPKRMRVREVEVVVLECAARALGTQAVGFSEIELLDRP